MEYIYGKRTGQLDQAKFLNRLQGFSQVWIDLGTGDGRFIEEMARQHPTSFFIGIDACRENLYRVAGRTPTNALFLIAGGEDLPVELKGLADRITINFPWGSLLKGLLEPDSKIVANLREIASSRTELEVRLNPSALAQAGWHTEAACHKLQEVLEATGFDSTGICQIERQALKTFPSSWAKRLSSHPEAQAYLLKASYNRQINRLAS